LVESVRASDIWKRAVASPRCYVEVPFALHTTAATLGLDGPESVLLRGTIDLVFEEDGRWILVDYKSDPTEGRLEMLVEEYKPQVKLYAKYWADQTKAEVQPGLFFVNTGQQVWL
jgi:ATP-dependent exoDNAse (exonuclease V) beta subunit